MSRTYDRMENTLQSINTKYITVDDNKKRLDREYVQRMLKHIIGNLEEPVFGVFTVDIAYVGSYFEKLKIRDTDEFDINLVLNVPRRCPLLLRQSVEPGYLEIIVNDECLIKYPGLNKIVTDGYFDKEKLRNKMKGMICKSLKLFSHAQWKLKDSGPAITIVMNNAINVDVVPTLKFEKNWPAKGFRGNPYPSIDYFYLVPKPLSKRSRNRGPESNRYWRTSFHAQEVQLLKNKERLKSAIKLIKKLRDTRQQKLIYSYCIKTMAFWLTEEISDDSFWKQKSLSCVFMKLLRKYHDYLKQGVVVYYWTRDFNIINTSRSDMANFANNIDRIIRDIEAKFDEDPTVVAKHILTPTEYSAFKMENGSELNIYQPPIQSIGYDQGVSDIGYADSNYDRYEDYVDSDNHQSTQTSSGDGSALLATAVGIGIAALAIGAFSFFKNRQERTE